MWTKKLFGLVASLSLVALAGGCEEEDADRGDTAGTATDATSATASASDSDSDADSDSDSDSDSDADSDSDSDSASASDSVSVSDSSPPELGHKSGVIRSPMPYDLRSDTVTQPTAAMRAAMAAAEVGDDCYGDDPSVLALEHRVATLLGKEAAVFLPSGTMANQIAVRLHCRPGDCIATTPGAHVRIHEDASAAALSGAQIMPIGSRHGFDVDTLAALRAEESCGWPPVRLVWLENTIGDTGGTIWPLDPTPNQRAGVDPLSALSQWARAQGRAVHLDGARLWNAHVATGTPLDDLAEVADTVSVALSKGLGAPVGSLLCGPAQLVTAARRLKHAFGGGLRQAGVLAAAGLHALDHHLERLAEDHERARRLAESIADLGCWDLEPPETNLVVARVRPPLTAAEDLCRPLRAAGVICYPNRAREVRFALHLGIDDDALTEVIAIIRRVTGNDD
jgi:threonine aldolase